MRPLVALSLLTACSLASGARSPAPATCPPPSSGGPGVNPFADSLRLSSLVGAYSLTLVVDSGPKAGQAFLSHLSLTILSAGTAAPDVRGAWIDPTVLHGSLNPLPPPLLSTGARVEGTQSPRTYLPEFQPEPGQEPQASDRANWRMVVLRWDPGSVRGTWQASGGLTSQPPSSGHFCLIPQSARGAP